MIATLPPTTHTLPKPQRLRLMRSTRKLSALLGTTPLLIDPREPMPALPLLEPVPVSDRGSIASALSFDSACSTPTGAPAALLPAPAEGPTSAGRPTLLLRINTIPPRTLRGRSNSQAWGRPASMTTSPPSPLSDAESVSDDVVLAARRKKMARLARTLGENVPLALVFPPLPEKPAHQVSLDVRLRDSLDSDRASIEEKGALSKPSLEKALPPSAFALPSAPSSFTLPGEPPSRTRLSTSSEHASTGASDRTWIPHIKRRSTGPTVQAPVQRRQVEAHVQRRGAGWTGEWNQEEEAVAKGLRELKHK
ncbi:hypothetical protein C8R44DRAFT_875573 [Mycena epipterygia]|nr:hypothetical protein C8R44DRAFT_875573 [Mycena epipterygia]